jgi:hypothetical protein
VAPAWAGAAAAKVEAAAKAEAAVKAVVAGGGR